MNFVRNCKSETTILKKSLIINIFNPNLQFYFHNKQELFIFLQWSQNCTHFNCQMAVSSFVALWVIYGTRCLKGQRMCGQKLAVILVDFCFLNL